MRRGFADLPLNAKGMVVVSLPVLAFLASLIAFVQFQRQARSAQGWVEHTYQVRSELRQISLLTVSAQAEARGYLLTGDSSLLDRYRAAREEIPAHVAALRRLIADNPAQRDRLRGLEAQIQRTVQAFSAMSAGAGSNAAAEMNRLTDQLSAMEAEENTLLQRRTAEMDAAERRFDAALAASAVIGLLGGFLSALIFTTRIGRRVRRLAGDARRMARGEPIQEDTGSTDEIAQLGHTLKHTSELLAARNMQLRAAQQDLESRVLQRTAELRETNEQLQRVNEVRQAVIGSSPLAIWAVDLHGRVKFWNPAAERIFGWKEGEVLDRPLPVIAEEQQDEFKEWLERFARGESLTAVERRRRKKDGTAVDVLIWTAPLRDSEGKIHGAIAIDSDITDQKVLEEQFRQSQKLEAVGRLAGGVAHDFNNLLTVILGYVEMLIAEAGEQEILVDYAREVQYAAERAGALTAQLLAFGRRQISQPKVLDLNETAGHSVKLLHRIIGEDIRIDVHLSPDVGTIRADPIHIDQVIMNLVVNARDAMPRGGCLTIETAKAVLDENYTGRHSGVRPGTYAMLAVSDTGTGMTAETKSRLFEPFFTTKEAGKGTGLGLSIVYGIVKQSGGEIMVYSEEGRGTTFKVYLPVIEQPQEPADSEAVLAGLRGSETVLLCEDEEHIRKLVQTMLSRQGYQVLTAETPDAALGVAKEHPGQIDLLLTDVVMPLKNGFDLAREVRELRKEIRVLFMSGYTDNRIAGSWVLDPGTPFLQKPFTAVALGNKVRETLGSPAGAL